MYTLTLHLLFLVFSILFLHAILTGKYKKALIIFIYSIPLKSVYILPFGFFVELWKFLSLLTMPLTFNYILKYGKIFPGAKYILLFFVFSILSTFSSAFIDLFSTMPGLDLNAKTIISQAIQLLIFINLLFIPVIFMRKENWPARNYFEVYVLFMTIMAVIGILQLIVYKASGINIFPIPRLDGTLQDEVFINYVGGVAVDPIFRVNGLSMEPKNFAFFLGTAIIFLIEAKITFKVPIFGAGKDLVYIAILGYCMSVTASSLGFAIIGIYLGLKLLEVKKFVLLSVYLLVAAPLLLTDVGQSIVDIVDARLFTRISTSGVMEDFDIATWDFFLDNPRFLITGVGYGNIHHIADAYLPDFAYWVSGTNWHAKMGFLYVISGGGLISLSLFFLLFYSYFNLIRKNGSSFEADYLKSILMVFFCIYILRQNEVYFLICGFCISFILMNKKPLKGNSFKTRNISFDPISSGHLKISGIEEMKISIITPSYNHGRFIEKCLDSVRIQSGNFVVEHIILDNCSTDETVRALDRYAECPGNVEVRIKIEADNGQTEAINRGLRLATGDVVCWLNTDEWYEEGVIAKVINYFETHTNVDVVFGDCYFVDQNGALVKHKREYFFSQSMLVYYGCFMPSCATFIRRRIIDAEILLDNEFKVTMDFDWYVRISKAGYRFDHIPVTIASFTWHDNNISSTYPSRRKYERRLVQDRFHRLNAPNFFYVFYYEIMRLFWIAFRVIRRSM